MTHEILQRGPAEARGGTVIAEDPAAPTTDLVAAVSGPAAHHRAGACHDAGIGPPGGGEESANVVGNDLDVRAWETAGQQVRDLLSLGLAARSGNTSSHSPCRRTASKSPAITSADGLRVGREGVTRAAGALVDHGALPHRASAGARPAGVDPYYDVAAPWPAAGCGHAVILPAPVRPGSAAQPPAAPANLGRGAADAVAHRGQHPPRAVGDAALRAGNGSGLTSNRSPGRHVSRSLPAAARSMALTA